MGQPLLTATEKVWREGSNENVVFDSEYNAPTLFRIYKRGHSVKNSEYTDLMLWHTV